jgi:hypothetical protein
MFISPVLSPTSDSTALSKAIPDHFETEREKKNAAAYFRCFKTSRRNIFHEISGLTK